MKIAIGNDHAGVALKNLISTYLKKTGHDVQNFGTDSEVSCDYPDIAHPVAMVVQNSEADLGILICGTANGVAMTANKHKGIRAAIAWNSEIAGIVHAHNNANILCIPARFVTGDEGVNIVEKYLSTSFEGGRHENRIKKIPC
ncbi:MAG: ribose 5-phosphate isomerase B [Cytophagales bacterium]|nr:ribose 5-phosphate isomerase B [Cytophagales bacterium]